ncbi:MAG: ABC transporter substrate-binding protein [Acidimicrobiia bacterium]
MTATAHVHSAPRRLDRHRRSRWAALIAAMVVALAALASLGSSASGAQAKADPNGVVKIASTLSPLGPLHFDPATSVVNADLTWEEMIFGTLMRWDANGQLQPWMAESVKVVDPQTVQMTLRKGLTFTDGTPYDAQAVATGLMHTKNDANAQSASSRHAGFRFLDTVTVDSPTQLTFKLNAAGANDFLESLAHREGSIVDPKQIGTGEIDTKPIGAGPFMFDTYTPDQILSVRKNKDFFDKKHFQFGGIDYVNATGPAATNGLLAGTVDIAPLAATDVSQVKANTAYNILSGTTDYQYIIMQMCPGKPPFDNQKFRQGVQLAFDRNAIIQLAFQGQATPATDLWPKGNVNFNPATEKINTYDPKKAKKLIAESGVTDPTFEMHYVAQITSYGPLTEILQSQLKAVGVNATIVPDQDILNGFILPQKAGAQVIPGSRRNVDKYQRLYATGAQTTLCGVARDDIYNTVLPTAGMSATDPARAALFKKADLMAAKNANPIPLVYTVNNFGLAKAKVGGTLALNAATGGLLLDNMTVSKS